MKGASPYLFRTGAFVGEFLDAFIADSDLEGGHSATSIETLLLVSPQIQSSLLTLFSPGEVEHVQAYFSRDLATALEFGRRIGKVQLSKDQDENGPDKALFLAQLIQDLCAKVNSLAPGERLLILGGWVCRIGPGHAIMYIVERAADGDSFEFTVCNTGDGVSLYHHHDALSHYPKDKHQTALNLRGISPERMASPDVWCMILQLRCVPSELNGPKILYEVILPHLAGATAVAGGMVSLFDSQSEARGGPMETIQRSGTCFYRCILSGLRFMSRRDGLSGTKTKQLMYALRVAYLQVCLSQMRSDATLMRAYNHSDARVVDIACRQARVAAVKLKKRDAAAVDLDYVDTLTGDIDAESQALLLLSEEESFRFLSSSGGSPSASASASASASPSASGRESCSPTTAKSPPVASLAAFESLELLADTQDRDVFKGAPRVGQNELFVDLLPPAATVANLQDIHGIFEHAYLSCNLLRAKIGLAPVETSLMQIVALVEQVFFDLIPVPPPPSCSDAAAAAANASASAGAGADAGNRGCWSDATGWGEEHQSRLLGVLSKLYMHYVCAVFTLPQTPARNATIRLCSTAIFCAFDAVIRVPTGWFLPPILQDYGVSLFHTFDKAETFASLSESSLLYRPEHATARHALLAYLDAPSSRQKATLFDFDVVAMRFGPPNFFFKKTNATFCFINRVRSAKLPGDLDKGPRGFNAFSNDNVWNWEELSEMKQVSNWLLSPCTELDPALSDYRDLHLLARALLEPDRIHATLQGGGEEGLDKPVHVWLFHELRPRIKKRSAAEHNGDVVFCMQTFKNESVCVAFTALERPQPSPVDIKALQGYLQSEENVLHTSLKVPFDLSPEIEEQLCTYLLYPHIAHPLVLQLFKGDRFGSLTCAALQACLNSIFFQPFEAPPSGGASPLLLDCIPARDRAQLGTCFGVLMDEAQHCPEVK